jgi:hypothetical protein
MTATRHTARVALELVGEHPGVVTVSAWKNVGICSWTGGATGPAVETLVQAMDKVRLPDQRLSWVHLIREGLPLPDSSARSSFIRVMKERQGELACVAIVVGGTGFWASAMRNALIGLRVLAPRSFEFRLHGTPGEVVEWLPEAHQRQTGVELPSESLARLIAQALKFEPSR